MKKIKKGAWVSLLLSAAMLASLLPAQAVFAAAGTLGDVNGDGKIDSLDAQTILKGGLNSNQSLAADVDQNNTVNDTDAQLILDYVAGKRGGFTKASISFAQSSISLGRNTTGKQSPTFNNANSSSVTWTSSNTSVATVDSNGTISTKASGSSTITATLFNGASASFTVNVSGKNQYFGIDVSYHNGNIDWNKVSKAYINNVDGNSGMRLSDTMDFAILRNGYGMDLTSQKDEQFEYNYQQAKKYGVPVGAYHATYALNVDQAKREAYLAIYCLQGKEFEYPIFYDMEDFYKTKDKPNSPMDGISQSTMTEMVRSFCQILRDEGYYTGVYSSASWYFSGPTNSSSKSFNRINIDSLKNTFGSDFPVWVANYPNGGYRSSGIPSYWETGYPWSMWQFASNGRANGIAYPAVDADKKPYTSYNVDVNVSNIDYAGIIKRGGYNRAITDTARASVNSGMAASIYANDLIK